jgi:SH3-like domain-containing protein
MSADAGMGEAAIAAAKSCGYRNAGTVEFLLDREGNWLRVGDYENEEGWIYKSLLSRVPAVVIISQKANIRSGPGMEHPVAWVAEKESSLKVLDMRGEWFKVSDGEETLGWIHRDVTWGFSGNSELEESSGEL